jgi:hypothetical protein
MENVVKLQAVTALRGLIPSQKTPVLFIFFAALFFSTSSYAINLLNPISAAHLDQSAPINSIACKELFVRQIGSPADNPAGSLVGSAVGSSVARPGGVTNFEVQTIITPMGSQGPNYKNLFSPTSPDAITNIKSIARRLQSLVQNISVDEFANLSRSIEIATPQFEHAYGSSAKLELLMLRFAIHKQSAIEEWLHSITLRDLGRIELISLGTFISEFDPSLIPNVSRAIALQLVTARKAFNPSTSIRERSVRLTPKRSLSFLLKVVNQWPEKLRHLIESNQSNLSAQNIPYLAFSKFVDDVNQIVNTSLGNQFGQFDGKFILAVLLAVQSELRKIESVQPIEAAKSGGLQITLPGSFFNGLANSEKSDIDFIYSHPLLKSFVKRPDFVMAMQNVFSEFGKSHPPLPLEDISLEVPDSQRSDPKLPDQLSELGTIAFKVSPNQIELRVFPVTFVSLGIKPHTYLFEVEEVAH